MLFYCFALPTHKTEANAKGVGVVIYLVSTDMYRVDVEQLFDMYYATTVHELFLAGLPAPSPLKQTYIR